MLALGPFRIEMARRIGRCNITNTETMETGFAKFAEKVCGGEANFVKQDGGRWYSDSWHLAILFPMADASSVTFELVQSGAVLRVGLSAID
ncbi:MAG: hypothetical protein IPP90_15075 [Gemmatimonadaceae bacterium]|nr:hypothetical protein [Gemmatimonadaceae bacterium]